MPILTNSGILPWFIALDGLIPIVITSRVMPGPITDQQPIIYAETAVPGLHYTPINPFRMGNRKLSFTVPIINRMKNAGNQEIMNRIELLRQTDQAFVSIFTSTGIQFSGPPRVIYNWGTHTPPLAYLVRKADFTHNAALPPSHQGFSQYTLVDFELEVDATSYLYTAWQLELRMMALAGVAQEGMPAGKRSY